MEIILPSFAKINLCLRVLGKRSDGYHDLQTVFQTTEFHDELRFVFAPGKFRIRLHCDSQIPSDSQNLIWKACEAFHARHPLANSVEIFIEKKIPMESGLGGGSSNAAATLIALSRLLQWPISEAELKEIATGLGADVPFFLSGGTALGEGRGDEIAPLQDAQWPSVLLIIPSVTCSTAAIYRYYDERNLLTGSDNSIKIHLDPRPESLKDLVSRIGNDLERVVFALYPELDSIKQKLLKSGAVAAALTGSGSAIFGLFENVKDLENAAVLFDRSVTTRFVTGAEYRSIVLGR